MFCTKCGTRLEDGMKFCTACGAPVEEISAGDSVPETEAQEPIAAIEETQALEAEEVASAEDVRKVEAPSDQDDVIETADDRLDDTTEFEPVEAIGVEEAAEASSSPVQQTSKETTAAAASTAAARPFPKGVLIGGIAVVAVIVIVALVMLFLPQGGASVVIDSKTFPDMQVRDAIVAQVDVDGDGVLSAPERDAVTGISIINDTVEFNLNNARAKATSIGYIPLTTVGARHEIDPGLFPNLETLVMPNVGLSSLDLLKNTRLQYVDVRANPLGEVDLSANKELKTFFCDDDVTLKGLDACGLYFTDLMVAVERDDAAAERGKDSVSIEYDTNGRPISRTIGTSKKTYSYDEQGRIVSEGVQGDVRSTQTYTYDPNGELKEYIWSHGPRFEPGAVEEEGFAYDQHGRVNMETSKENGLPSMSGSFMYSDDTILNPYRFDDSVSGLTEEYDFDASGRLTAAVRRTSESALNTKISYSSSGSISDMTVENASKLTLSFDGKGYPTAGTMMDSLMGMPESDLKFACNSDGYVTDIRTTMVSDSSYERHLSLHYVKMVAPYDERPSLRYVPRFEPMLNTMFWVHSVIVPVDKALFSGVGDSSFDPLFYSCTVYEVGPEFVSLRNAGLFPEALTNANEQKLAKWDREHWKDGLNLS